ncbi:ABC transporter ATP-binding protein [Candidatus Bipolaricaulota bacterium]|nr:ABC transporter ATP-binding protein [Candidatus Bipolaricaulota bacterium]
MRIEVRNVSFAYPDSPLALNQVSLEIASGSCCALIGPNGSGKSTLLRIVSGVLPPKTGVVLLDDTPIDTRSAREIARHLAMVEQERVIGFDFSVREVVALGRIPHRSRFAKERPEDVRAIDHAMDLADVCALANRSIRAISGGERQRVHLAMALAQEPAVLLLDEPTTYLDLRHQTQFMSIVRQRACEGMTVLIAIHDLTMAAQVTNHMVLMGDGQVVVAGQPADVLTAENVESAFGVRAIVGRHPLLGSTYVLPNLAREREG